MQIEFEATFQNIEKDEARKMLKKAGAKLARPEFLQRRVNFDVPADVVKNSWMRVRDEGDKITMSIKKNDGPTIREQQEICLEVSDFDEAIKFLKTLGFREKSYQETKRELWMLGDVEVTIDEWPFLEPFVEVEAKSEEAVKNTCQKIGLDYKKALFCPITVLYSMKYSIPCRQIDCDIPKITFDIDNPFIF